MDTQGKKKHVRRLSLDVSGFLEAKLLQDAEADGIMPGQVAKRILYRHYRGKAASS